jgi:hypothetical protein
MDEGKEDAKTTDGRRTGAHARPADPLDGQHHCRLLLLIVVDCY